MGNELQQSVVCSTYAACKRRVLLFDFGGTLFERERIGKYHKRDMNATTGRKPTARVFEALATLAADYRARGDGCVRLYGRPRRVTHPIASYGMEAG